MAYGESETTDEALARLEEILELRTDEGLIKPENIQPSIVVSATPRYAKSQKWFSTQVLRVLARSFDSNGLRICEACMAPRTLIEDGYLHYSTGPIGLEEIVALDDRHRGKSQPARTAIWVDETARGVSIKIVDLRTARIIFAQNVTPDIREYRDSLKTFTLTQEAERRARGESLAHAFADFALYPGQHISLDWTEQWGKYNNNLSGLTISLLDPVVGIGAVYYRSLPLFDSLLGAKLILSIPTALSRALAEADADLLDPIVSAVALLRIPFGRSNYGAVVTLSTNGQVGLGISLLNTSLLPVLP